MSMMLHLSWKMMQKTKMTWRKKTSLNFPYRFGVLLAANAQAHHYWTSMRVIDAYEQGIVQQLTPHA